MSEIEQDPTAYVDRSDFLKTMRSVANSVTIVTTTGIAGRHGATVSAFCSVSADPPTILVCLHSNTRIASTVAANGHFCVNVLPDSSQFVADRFAGVHDEQIEDRFDGIDVDDEYEHAPMIKNSTAFCCEISNIIECGSHRIFTGHVVAVKEGKPNPLIYLDGKYREIKDSE